MEESKVFRRGEFVVRKIDNSVFVWFRHVAESLLKKNLSFRSFLIESSRSSLSSMVAIYVQNRMKSKKDRNCLTSCDSARSLPFKNVISDLLFSVSLYVNARSMLVSDTLRLFHLKLDELRKRSLTNGSLENGCL